MAWFFRHETCGKKLSALTDRLETAERRLRAVEADFTDLYDRVTRQVNRIVKRDERDRAGEAATQKGAVDEVSARILARRQAAHGIRAVVPE